MVENKVKLLKKIKQLQKLIEILKKEVDTYKKEILYEKSNTINTKNLVENICKKELKDLVIYFLNIFLELYSFKNIFKNKDTREYFNNIILKIEEKYNLEKIIPEKGEVYNPKFHRCISEGTGKIVKKVLRIGFKYKKSYIASIYSLVVLE